MMIPDRLPSADEAVDLLLHLISNACVNTGDPTSGNEIRSVRTIQEFLGEEGTVIEPLPTRGSVIYRIAGTDPDAPRLLLLPHLDVVPANADDWTHDPFTTGTVEGVVWGRGAVDMLNVTAAMVVVYRWLRDGILAPPSGDVILACVADEEAGGTYGARHLVENHWDLIACDYVLTEVAGPNLGAADSPRLPVTVAEKGPLWRSATVRGTAGHGSQPYGRANAVVRLADAFSLIGTADDPVNITTEWEEFAPHLGLPAELIARLTDADKLDGAIAEIAIEEPTLARWIHACTHMTLSPNMIEGGSKVNMIPDAATGEIDVRLLPGQDVTDLEDHLRKTLGPDLFDEIDLEPVLDMTANGTSPTGPLWEAIGDAAEAYLGSRSLAPTLTPVTTDARFFRERGVPAFGVGLFDDTISFPEMLEMFHGVDERVSAESVRLTTRFLGSVVSAFSLRCATDD